MSGKIVSSLAASVGALGLGLAMVAMSPAPVSAQTNRVSALVEDVKGAPDAGVEFMDFVYGGQTINLGATGELVLSYLGSCRLEKIKGGTVTVGVSDSRVQGGSIIPSTRPCDGKKFATTTQTAEAGAAVKRDVPGGKPGEVAIKSMRPVFRWVETGTATVEILSTASGKPELVWTGKTDKQWIEVPAQGVKLQQGVRYIAQVSGIKGPVAKAVFMIDPDLSLGDTVLNRTVPLAP